MMPLSEEPDASIDIDQEPEKAPEIFRYIYGSITNTPPGEYTDMGIVWTKDERFFIGWNWDIYPEGKRIDATKAFEIRKGGMPASPDDLGFHFGNTISAYFGGMDLLADKVLLVEGRSSAYHFVVELSSKTDLSGSHYFDIINDPVEINLGHQHTDVDFLSNKFFNSGDAAFDIEGDGFAGGLLTAELNTSDPDGDDGSYTYEWETKPIDFDEGDYDSSGVYLWTSIGDQKRFIVPEYLPGNYLLRSKITYTDSMGFDAVVINHIELEGQAIEPDLTPEPELIAPELLRAVAIDDEIVLTFDSELDSSNSPSADFWTIYEDGRSKLIESIEVKSSVGKIVFTLSHKIDSLSDVIIGYNDLKGDQDEGVVQSKDGIDLASIDDFIVDNQTTRASTPLEVLSSEVDGNQIILGFSRELDSVQPRNGVFRVESDGKKIKIIDIVLDADSREAYLTLQRPVRFHESVSLTYTDADGDQRKNTIQDLDGNDLASLNLELENTTDRTSVFEVDTAEIDGYLLTLDFAEELDTSLPKKKRFKVQVNKRRRKISSLSSSPEDGVVNLELTAPVTFSDDVLISYKDLKGNQASGVIQDLFGNDLKSFKKLVVENTTTDSSSPVLEEAFIEDNLLVMQFDELLSPGIIKSSRIKLTSDGKRVRVKSAELLEADTEVLFELKKSLPSEVKLLSLDYKDPKRDQRNGVLQDEFGNDFTGVKSFAVEVI